jgi:hypothetical protein
MAAAKTTSTVKTLQAPKRVIAKTAGMRGDAKNAAGAGKGPKTSSEGDALDVLRLFVKTYANL